MNLSRYLFSLTFLILVLAGCSPVRQAAVTESPVPQGAMSEQVFYDDLSPYGQWIDYPQYGYVWSPSEGAGFQPYTNGYWMMTNDGETWVSNYSWGWAPFHYGRWISDNSYGWLWVPGNVWGPAWVSWRQSGNYYGWAPLGPEVGADITVSFGSGYTVPANRWVFVPRQYVNSPAANHYYVDRGQNATIINGSTLIQNTYIDNNRRVIYISGPNASDLALATGTRITPVPIHESTTSGQSVGTDGALRIFRPAVNSTLSSGSNRPAPPHVVPLTSFHPAGQTNTPNDTRVQTAPSPEQRVNPSFNSNPNLGQSSPNTPVREFKPQATPPNNDNPIEGNAHNINKPAIVNTPPNPDNRPAFNNKSKVANANNRKQPTHPHTNKAPVAHTSQVVKLAQPKPPPPKPPTDIPKDESR